MKGKGQKWEEEGKNNQMKGQEGRKEGNERGGKNVFVMSAVCNVSQKNCLFDFELSGNEKNVSFAFLGSWTVQSREDN